MKRRHMAHHFHDETGNFGITSRRSPKRRPGDDAPPRSVWDRLFGTFYDKAGDREKSPTVFNLG